ncbi:MAG: hypothetical protein LBI12_01590, partial [Treponema sp.]|nr:hypothetical protein [Treponema sp.]
MFVRSFDDSINTIHGFGLSAIQKVSKLGINKVSDLLTFFPRDWEDRSKNNPLNGYRNGKVNTVV